MTEEFGEKYGGNNPYSDKRDYDSVSEEEFYRAMGDVETFFFLAGFPKCATTTIASILDCQEDVTLPKFKEPFFFTTDEYDYGMGFYWEKYFSNYDGERIVGEASTATSFMPYTSKRISEKLPDAKIIFSLRNPTDRAFSNWWMYKNSGLENLSFENAIEWELRELDQGLLPVDDENHDFWPWMRRREMTKDPYIRRRTVRTYVMRGYYARHIERFRQYFSDDQLLYVFQEDLKKDRAAVTQEILDFLGLDQEVMIPEQDYHRSGKKNLARLKASKLAAPYRNVVPDPLWNIGQTVVNAGSEVISRTGMKDETRKRLVDHYRKENERLEAIVDRDLSHWNK